MAGSTELGRNVILAGQAGIAGHCKLGDGVIVTAQSGTSHDIEPGRMISGSPAFDNKQWLRSVAIFNKLPELAKAVRMASNSPRKKPGAGIRKEEAQPEAE
jgi:UDP-3-O-[3-hydroxymyristoyl] glucosamine N-acyltransferase